MPLRDGASDVVRFVRGLEGSVCFYAEDILRHGYDPEMGSFVQSYGSKAHDARLLLIPLVGFLPADDPRVQGAVTAMKRRLMNRGFVWRYDAGAMDDVSPAMRGPFPPARSGWSTITCSQGGWTRRRRCSSGSPTPPATISA